MNYSKHEPMKSLLFSILCPSKIFST